MISQAKYTCLVQLKQMLNNYGLVPGVPSCAPPFVEVLKVVTVVEVVRFVETAVPPLALKLLPR